MKKILSVLLALLLGTLGIGQAFAAEKIAAPAFADLVEDVNIEKLEQEGSSAAAKENTGSVTIAISDTMKLDHENEVIEFMYKHESTSTHAAVCQIIVKAGEDEVLLGQTGLIPAGYGIYKTAALPDTKRLQTGYHKVVLRLLFYDVQTGVRADFNTDIPGYLLA